MKKVLILLFFVVLSVACTSRVVIVGGPDSILVVPGSHLDIGFTDVPSKVKESRVATLDAAMAAAEKDPDFRWNEEGAWVVHAWLEKHANDAALKAKLRSLLQSGRFAVGASWCSPHAALFPHSLHHLFAFNETIKREFGVQPAYAVMNDVPAFPEALVDAAAAAGVQGFLLGVNLSFSQPLPAYMTSGPFIWRSSQGSQIVVSVDKDGYVAAFSKWGIDPGTALFFENKKFGDKRGFDVTEAAITDAGKGRSGLVVAQQAFDNWDCRTAERTAMFAREWNTRGCKPPIKVGVPTEAFAAWKKLKLPTLEGEWGGEWEMVRATCPVWTARLRHAANSVPPDAPLERRLAIATAMDHSGSMGPGWPNYFTEDQTKQGNAEWAAIFREGIVDYDTDVMAAVSARNTARIAKPNAQSPQKLTSFSEWIDTSKFKPQIVRNGPSASGAFFDRNAQAVECPAGIEVKGPRISLWARLDRSTIPGDDKENVTVGWDVPLRGPASEIRAWPAGSKAGMAGRWLRGKQPLTQIAPDGLLIETAAGRLSITSALVFTFRILDVDSQAHLQALLVYQSRLCALKGGQKKVLPFSDLYPGEPALLDAELAIEISGMGSADKPNTPRPALKIGAAGS